MDELVPIFEREGIVLSVEPHPEDWVETFHPAIDIIRSIGSKNVKMSHIAPHTFYYGDDLAAMLKEAAPVLHHVRVADTYNHKASSQLRYIVNPPGSNVRSTSTSTSAKARSTGICSSRPWARSSSTACFLPASSPGRTARRIPRASCVRRFSAISTNIPTETRRPQ